MGHSALKWTLHWEKDGLLCLLCPITYEKQCKISSLLILVIEFYIQTIQNGYDNLVQ